MTTTPTPYLLLTEQEVAAIIRTGINLGHTAATMGLTLTDARTSATTGTEFAELIHGLTQTSNRRRTTTPRPRRPWWTRTPR